MTVYELNKYELEELKETYFYDNNGDCQLYYEFWQDIPDFVIIDWYSGVEFVKEAFFCNIKDNNFENCGAAYQS